MHKLPFFFFQIYRCSVPPSGEYCHYLEKRNFDLDNDVNNRKKREKYADNANTFVIFLTTYCAPNLQLWSRSRLTSFCIVDIWLATWWSTFSYCYSDICRCLLSILLLPAFFSLSGNCVVSITSGQIQIDILK